MGWRNGRVDLNSYGTRAGHEEDRHDLLRHRRGLEAVERHFPTRHPVGLRHSSAVQKLAPHGEVRLELIEDDIGPWGLA